MDKETKLQMKREREKVRATQKALRDQVESEETIHVRFDNKESPKAALDFFFMGKAWHLEHGREYDLPVSVVEHLNNLATPIYRMYDQDEHDNHLRTEAAEVGERVIGYENRFALIQTSFQRQPTPKKTKQKESFAA